MVDHPTLIETPPAPDTPTAVPPPAPDTAPEQAAAQRLTAEQYFQLPESLHITNLLAGEMIVSPAPDLTHQETLFNFAFHLRSLQPGGKFWLAPTDVYLNATTVVQPDLFWLAPDSACQSPDGKRLYGPPDLVIEFLSPGTAKHDGRKKLDLYEASGVREYWIVDPHARTVQVYTLAAGATEYDTTLAYTPADTFTSPVLGIPVAVGQLFPPVTAPPTVAAPDTSAESDTSADSPSEA